MKTFLFNFLFFFLSTLFLYSQSEPNFIWSKTYGGSNDDYGIKLIQGPDGSYYMIGFGDSTDFDITQSFGNNDIYVIKLNGSGEILWQKTFGGSAFERPADIIIHPDGGILICGTTNSTNGNLNMSIQGFYDGFIFKLDSSGNIVWSKAFGGSNYDEFNYVFVEQNGNIKLVGESYSNDGDLPADNDLDIGSHWIVSVNNENGNLISSSIVPFLSDYYDDVLQVIQTADGGIVFAGQSYNDEFGDNAVPLFRKIDSNNVEVFNTPYLCEDCTSGYFIDVIELSDGTLYTLGANFTPSSDPIEDDLVFKFNANGQFVEDEVVIFNPLITDELFGSASRFIKTNNGFVISGYTFNDPFNFGNDNVLFVNYSVDAGPSYRIIEGNGIEGIDINDCGLGSIIQNSNGNFVYITSTYSTDGVYSDNHSVGFSDIFATEFNFDTLGTPEVVLNNDLHIFPNPVANFLTITNSDAFEMKELSVLDLSGKAVLNIKNPSNTIDVKGLAKGMYLLEITTSSNQKMRQKFIKQ